MTQHNIYHSLSAALSHLGASDQQKLSNKINAVAQDAGVSPSRYLIFLIQQLDEAVDLLAYVNLPADRIEKSRRLLRRVQEQIHSAASQTTGSNFISALGGRHIIDTISFMGDAAEALGIDAGEAIDREELARLTKQLISDLLNSDLEEYPKRALHLKLTAIQRVLDEVGVHTDGDIRRRVKSVYADYCAEFRRFDAKHEDFAEKMLKWARAAGKFGIFALALTADSSAVMTLLPPPQGG